MQCLSSESLIYETRVHLLIETNFLDKRCYYAFWLQDHYNVTT